MTKTGLRWVSVAKGKATEIADALKAKGYRGLVSEVGDPVLADAVMTNAPMRVILAVCSVLHEKEEKA